MGELEYFDGDLVYTGWDDPCSDKAQICFDNLKSPPETKDESQTDSVTSLQFEEDVTQAIDGGKACIFLKIYSNVDLISEIKKNPFRTGVSFIFKNPFRTGVSSIFKIPPKTGPCST